MLWLSAIEKLCKKKLIIKINFMISNLDRVFIIEFMIKIDTSDLKVVKNANTGATLEANGSTEVRKVIIASDDNSGMGSASIMTAASGDQIQKVGEALTLYEESGAKSFKLQNKIGREFLSMGVLNAGWRIEVGTKQGDDLGKIYFRSFTTNGITNFIQEVESGNEFLFDTNAMKSAHGKLARDGLFDGDIEDFKKEATLNYMQNGAVDSGDSVLQNAQWRQHGII